MNLRNKFIIKRNENSQTLFNFISTVFRTCIGMITMPIFTRMLGATQYGLYSIYVSWLTIISCFICLNVGSSLGTGFYKFKNDYYKFRSSTLIEGTIIAIGFALLAFTFQRQISSITGYSFVLVLLLVIQAFFEYICNFANLSWTYEKHAGKNMILAVGALTTTTALSIIIVHNWWGEESKLFLGRVIGVALPEIVIGLLVWIIIFRKEPYGFNKTYWKFSISFGFPIVFHTLSQQVLGQSDRIMMERLGTAGDQIGIYSFFYSFVAIMTAILNALNNSWCPFLYDRLETKSYDDLNKKVRNYVQVFTVLAFGFLMLSREVVKLFANAEYWSGVTLIPILVCAVYATYIYQFAVNYEFFNEKPKVVAIGTVMAAAVNIILNYLFIPQYGMHGAAVATLLSYSVLCIMHMLIVRSWKLEKYPLSLKPQFIGLLVILAASGLYYILEDFIICRWVMGAIAGGYLIISVKRRKTIF